MEREPSCARLLRKQVFAVARAMNEVPPSDLETVTRIDAANLRRVHVGEHPARPPMLVCDALGLENDIRRKPRRFIAKDGTAVTALPIHTHTFEFPQPSEETGAFGITDDQLAAGIEKL